MNTTKLYIIRHGHSQGNLHDLFVGHSDLDLTELGYEQAGITADFLDSIPIDVIYSSDLSRAYHTAEAVARRKGLPVNTDAGLREIYAGIWECASFKELLHSFPEEFRVWNEDFGNCTCPQGESIRQLQIRMTETVEKIAKENPGKSVAIFSHAVAIRVLSATWLGLSLSQMQDHPWPSNASVTHAIYENGRFTMVEYSRDDFMGDKRTTLD